MNCNGVRIGFVNSLYILTPSLVLTISLSIITGYGLALWNVKWANGFLFVLFICAFVPFQIIMYPLIKITGALHIYGTTFGIAVIHSVLSMPFLTLIFRNYFKGMPPQIIAAAMIDSGSFWRIFFEIVLPMSGNIMSDRFHTFHCILLRISVSQRTLAQPPAEPPDPAFLGTSCRG